MSQLVATECALLLGHPVELRLVTVPRDEPPWQTRWRELIAAPVYAPGTTCPDPDDQARVVITHLIVRGLLTERCEFLVTEEYPAGTPVRGPSVVASEHALLLEVERLAFQAAVSRCGYPLIVHAGAVSSGDVALIFPAASGAGKTTLTYGLAARGWLPLCDDICPLDERADGAFVAVGCPRCGHLNLHSEGILRRSGIELDGPVAGLSGYYRPAHWGQPAPVRAIVVPHHQEGAALSIEALTQAEGAAALYGATFRRERISRHDEWAAARRLAVQVPAFRLTYGSLDSALAGVDAIIQMDRRGVAAGGPPGGGGGY